MSMQQYPFSPRSHFTEEELAAFLEQERQRKEAETASMRELFLGPPAKPEVTVPDVPSVEPAPASGSRIGLTVPVTDRDILVEAMRVQREQEDAARKSMDTEEQKQAKVKRATQQMLNRSVTPEGTDIGTFGKSDILLHTDGYVMGEDGQPRKASGWELLKQSLGRQVLYRGAEYEREMARITAERERRFTELKQQGMDDQTARENIDSWYSGQLTEVNKQFRDISETWLAAVMRGTGLTSSAVEELYFDTLPLYFEVDEQGQMAHPDSWADSLAYTLHQARRSGIGQVADLTGMTEGEVQDLYMKGRSYLGSAASAVYDPGGAVLGAAEEALGTKGPDLLPVPFNPIDREATVDSAERGRRAAANTGSFWADVAMANARGRSFHDGMMAIPSYRQQLGDSQWMSLVPAMGVELMLPGGPIDLGLKGLKAVRGVMKAGILGDTLKLAADVGGPTQWENAYRLTAEMADMVDEGGTLDVVQTAAQRGDPARVVAANTAREMATPFTLQALVREEGTTFDELLGAANTSESGRHIIARLAEEVPMRADGTALTDVDRAIVDRLVLEWRLGAEASTVQRSLQGDLAGRSVARALDNTVLDTVGERGFNAFKASPLYAPVRKLAAEGGSAAEVAAAFRKAATEAGAPAIRSDHRVMRMLLSLSDETAAAGARRAFEVVHPLARAMRAVKEMPLPSPGLRYGAGLERAWRRTMSEVVDAHMPRDTRFVTDRLMVPKELVTRDTMKRVGHIERALYNPTFTDGKFVLKEGDPDAIMERVLSVLPGATAQRPGLVNPLRSALSNGELDLKQHAFVQDALREAAWRELVGDATPTMGKAQAASAPSFSTRQTDRAAARLGFKEQVLYPLYDVVHTAVRAATTGPTKALHGALAAMPETEVSKAIVTNLRKYNDWWDDKLVRRWLTEHNELTPYALRQTSDAIANDIALVQRKYRQELAATVKQMREAHGKHAGLRALEEMAARRWRRIGDQAVEKFRQTVRAMARASEENFEAEPTRRMPEYVEHVALALYRNGQARSVNIGPLMDELRRMSPAQQDQFVEMAEAIVANSARSRQWQTIMRDFFTRSASREQPVNEKLLNDIALALPEATAADPSSLESVRSARRLMTELDPSAGAVMDVLEQVAEASVLAPTPTNVQTVVNRLRKTLPTSLTDRGAAVLTPTGYRDASLETAQLWQLSVDEQATVARHIETLLDTNPELFVRLTPSINDTTVASTFARAQEYQLPIAVEKAAIKRLWHLGQKHGLEMEELKKPYMAALRDITNPVDGGAEAIGKLPGTKQGLPFKDRPKRGALYNLTRWTRARMKPLGPGERAKMAAQTVQRMFEHKTLYPLRSGLGLAKAGDVAGKVDALNQAVGRLMDAALGSANPRDPASKYTVTVIRRLRASGVPESAIHKSLVDSSLDAVDNVVGSYVENEVRNTMRRYGYSAFGAKGSLENLAGALVSVPIDEAYSFAIAPGLREVYEMLHSRAATGRLLPLLDALQGRTMLKEKAYGDWLWGALGDLIEGTRQTSAYGLLSAGLVLGGPLGIVPVMLPLTRYIGLNVLTAPMMMVGTLGASGAAKALGQTAADLGRKARGLPLVNTIAPQAPDAIVFRDPYGKEWTRREFDELCEQWNQYMSRAEVDQSANVIRTMQREARVMATKEGAATTPWGRQALRYMNPFMEAPGMQFAVWTDTMFRRGAFAAALRDGYKPAQAAELARASVLDYGAVHPFIKQRANKYLLFATFRAASTSEILKSIFAGRDEWLRVMRVQMQMQKAAEAWTFGADHDRVRSFTTPGPMFDYRQSAVAGPQEVFASGAADLVSLTAFAATAALSMPGAFAPGSGVDGGDIVGRLVAGVSEENIQPLAQLIVTMLANQRPTSRGRLVNDTWVAAMQNAGQWEWARKRFNIKPIHEAFQADEMRPGAPTFKGQQYVFKGNGFRDFQLFTYLSIIMTFGRATQDYTKAMAASPYPPGEGYDPKYRAIVPWWVYLSGAGTPIRLKSPEDTYQRSLNRDKFLNR